MLFGFGAKSCTFFVLEGIEFQAFGHKLGVDGDLTFFDIDEIPAGRTLDQGPVTCHDFLGGCWLGKLGSKDGSYQSIKFVFHLGLGWGLGFPNINPKLRLHFTNDLEFMISIGQVFDINAFKIKVGDFMVKMLG